VWIGAAVAALVAALVGAGVAGCVRPGRSPGPAHASSVVEVTRGTVTATVSATGSVEVVHTRGLSFGSEGVVTELTVKAGDRVDAGNVLARIDSAGAQDAVHAAQAQVDAARAALDWAHANQAAPAAVACPAAFHLSPSPSPSASPGAGPSSPPPARPTGGRPSSGPPTPARACATAGGGRGSGDPVASAEQQLNNAELALAQAQRRLAGTVLIAPVAGRVISVAGTVGSAQRPGGTGFIVLGDLTDTAVRAQFSEADVAPLAVGQEAAVTLVSRAEPYPGTVSQIAPAGTATGRLVRFGVVVAFDSAPPDPLPGQSANVVVTTARADGVLYVPTSAVTGLRDGAGTVTVRAGGRDRARTVTIGLRGDRYTEIRSGLDQGERVVV
jgi:HlyD family secretion protein